MQHGSRESFKLIDYQYPLSIAKLAYKSGARSISLVSAVGAHEGSFNYYFHIKGKLENKIKKIGFENICFARPGHLLGKRKDFRGFEIPFLEMGLRVAAPFMQGPIKNFRQVEARKVAESMVSNTRSHKKEESYLLREKGFKICLVSPELQGFKPEVEIEKLQNYIKNNDIYFDTVCTKYPLLWESFEIKE